MGTALRSATTPTMPHICFESWTKRVPSVPEALRKSSLPSAAPAYLLILFARYY
jgi:hypothetical protein